MSKKVFFSVAAITPVTVLGLMDRESVPNSLYGTKLRLEGFNRLRRSIATAGAVFLDYKWNTLGKDDDLEVWKDCHRRNAQRLVQLAERNGGLYIKVGQAFAAMNHLLPAEYCDGMASLQNAVSPRPLAEINRVIKEDCHCEVNDLFERFDEAPLAAASMAQVHRARYKNKEVIVKVQYIDVSSRFDGDLRTIQSLSALAGIAFPGFDFSAIIERVRGTLEAELDFRKEVSNSDRCESDFVRWYPNQDVVVPPVIRSILTPRIMVCEFIDQAVKVTDIEGLQKMGLKPADVASLVVDAFARQIFLSGFVHADPHPGNMLVRVHPNSSWRKRPQLVVLDHGLYTSLTDEERLTFAEFWRCVAMHDDDGTKKILHDFWKIQRHDVFATVFFQRPYGGKHHTSVNPRMSSDDVNELRMWNLRMMNETTEILKAIPASMTLVLRNINTVRAVHLDLGAPIHRVANMTFVALDALKFNSRMKKLSLKAMALLCVWRDVLDDKWKMFILKHFYPRLFAEVQKMTVAA